MRGDLRSLILAAALLSAPAGGSEVLTIQAKPTDSTDRPRRRVWSPAVRRYVLKEGNSAVDNARRERAEAKRQRKALARASRPSAGGRQP